MKMFVSSFFGPHHGGWTNSSAVVLNLNNMSIWVIVNVYKTELPARYKENFNSVYTVLFFRILYYALAS